VQDLKGQRTGASSLHSTRQKETKVEVGLQKQDEKKQKKNKVQDEPGNIVRLEIEK
jgi:hypothetical protein